jgi:hypothetical protein
MSTLLVALTAVALVAVTGAHVAILVLLGMGSPRHRALVALLVPPLAPYWAWREGMRKVVFAWGAGLLLYAVGVALLSR